MDALGFLTPKFKRTTGASICWLAILLLEIDLVFGFNMHQARVTAYLHAFLDLM